MRWRSGLRTPLGEKGRGGKRRVCPPPPASAPTSASESGFGILCCLFALKVTFFCRCNWKNRKAFCFTFGSKVKGQCHDVTSSVWCMIAHNSTTRSRRRTSKFAARSSVPRVTFCTSSRSKGQRSRSPVRLTPKITYFFRTERSKNFILGIRMVGWSTMTHITDLRRDLEAETSEWLFKSPLAGGGGILWRPHLPAAQAACSVTGCSYSSCCESYVGS